MLIGNLVTILKIFHPVRRKAKSADCNRTVRSFVLIPSWGYEFDNQHQGQHQQQISAALKTLLQRNH